MTALSDSEKAREKKKIVAGLLLTGVVFGWFLYFLISHIPG